MTKGIAMAATIITISAKTTEDLIRSAFDEMMRQYRTMKGSTLYGKMEIVIVSPDEVIGTFSPSFRLKHVQARK